VRAREKTIEELYNSPHALISRNYTGCGLYTASSRSSRRSRLRAAISNKVYRILACKSVGSILIIPAQYKCARSCDRTVTDVVNGSRVPWPWRHDRMNGARMRARVYRRMRPWGYSTRGCSFLPCVVPVVGCSSGTAADPCRRECRGR